MNFLWLNNQTQSVHVSECPVLCPHLARMAEADHSSTSEQLPLQLCLVGEQLARDSGLQQVARAFQVRGCEGKESGKIPEMTMTLNL